MSGADRLTAFRINLPLRRPFRSAHGTESVRDVVLVRCRTADGIEGWGECPTLSDPGYTGETTDLAWAALVGGGPLGPMASGAIADARLDARLRTDGRSLAEYLGCEWPEVFSLHVVDLDSTVRDGDYVKVKVTPSSIGRLRDLVDVVGSRLLAIDGNGSFDSLDQIPSWLPDLRLGYVEQPFPPGREEESRAAADRADALLALDESIGTIGDVERLLGPGDLVNLKPARVGGVESAVALADRARELGVGAFVGGMLESGIGRAAALALAGRGGWTFPSDLGPSARYFDEDICEPLGEREDRPGFDHLRVPTGPGIGRTPDPDRLAAVTVTIAEIPAPSS